MKRPLCLLVVSFAMILFVLQVLILPRYEAKHRNGAQETESRQDGTRIRLTGCLHSKEQKKGRLIYYLKEIQILEVSENQLKTNSNNIPTIQFNTEKKKIKGAVCYISESTSSHPVGMWLCLEGEILSFDRAENEGQFNAAEYYDSIGYPVRLWECNVIDTGESYDRFGERLVNIKQTISGRYRRAMKEENAGLLTAMLLGDKTNMNEDIKNLYRKSGIAHVLAISGLHISMLGMCFYKLLRKLYLPPPLCSVFGMLLVVVYIKMTGFSASSFRAVCMFIMFMTADLLKRTYDLKTALAFSALLLLLRDPRVLFQAGFLLSFFAVLGLAVVDPILQDKQEESDPVKAHRKPGRSHKLFEKLRTNLCSGFSVQVFLFPVTLWFYYEFPLYSFLLNFIIIPLMSIVMACGVIGAFPGMQEMLWFADAILSFCEWLCRLAEKLPGAVRITGRPDVWQMILYYVLILLWILYYSRKTEAKKTGVRRLARFVVPVLCMGLFLLPQKNADRVDMLSVGQGDCICMRDSRGNVVLVDGGSSDVEQVGKYRVIPFLKYNGISKIDVVFLSHAHEDHYSAIAELLADAGESGISIGTLCLPKDTCVAENDDGQQEAYRMLSELAQKAGCRVAYVDSGDRVICGKMKFYCVSPRQNGNISDENDRSMVLLATLSDFSMLFTGDISSECDAQVIQNLKRLGVEKIHCLKTPHHGAGTSTSEKLLETFQFDLALISCGAGNKAPSRLIQFNSRCNVKVA